jgi:hypothetical protein
VAAVLLLLELALAIRLLKDADRFQISCRPKGGDRQTVKQLTLKYETILPSRPLHVPSLQPYLLCW